ncbi:MAG: N-acetyltransferase [Chitinophagaceae bacterium]|nr:N-acetyltransferase [Chitinophagaceae bacterium]
MSTNSYLIRSASITDIELIRSLCFEVWPQTYASIISQEQIEYMLDRMYSPLSLQQQMEEGAHFILLYNDALPIGFASYQVITPTHCKLHKLYVLPTQQGKGGGRVMIQHILVEIKEKGIQHLELQVNRNNSAVTFYERLGFYKREVADFDIGNGFFMNDYIMQIDLV